MDLELDLEMDLALQLRRRNYLLPSPQQQRNLTSGSNEAGNQKPN